MLMEKLDDEERKLRWFLASADEIYLFGLCVSTEDLYALNSSGIRSINSLDSVIANLIDRVHGVHTRLEQAIYTTGRPEEATKLAKTHPQTPDVQYGHRE